MTTSVNKAGAKPKNAHPDAILAALSDEVRLRVFGALVGGTNDTQGISESLGLRSEKVDRALARLTQAGLISEKKGVFELVSGSFADALRLSVERQKDDFPGVDDKTADELGKFFKEGRLTHIPPLRPKRMLILDYLARSFEPGVYYPEKLVNAILRPFHPDTASLRRFLVDEGFLERKAGKYWRTGGTVAVD